MVLLYMLTLGDILMVIVTIYSIHGSYGLGYPHFWKLPQHLTGFLGAEELVHATGLVVAAATFARDPATRRPSRLRKRKTEENTMNFHLNFHHP